MTAAAGYIRVSTRKQAEGGYSLDEQRQAIVDRCAAEGWDLTLYEDAGLSAGEGKHRPDLERLLADAEAGRFSVVVFRDLDRVGRSVVDLSRIVGALERVRVVTLEGRNIDRSTAEGRLQFNMLASVAEYERAKIGERVAGSARSRAQRGLFPGGRRMKYGYVRRGKDEAPEIIPAQAAVVREIYALADAGVSQRKICQALKAEGVKTQQGCDWEQATIGRILRDPTYKGSITIKGETVYEGGPWAIVAPELWDRVGQLLTARDNAPGAGRGRKPKHHLLIGGMLTCGSCGGVMQARSYPSGREVYECRRRNVFGGESCAQRPIMRALIDGPLVDYFATVALDAEATRRDYLARSHDAIDACHALAEEAGREEQRAQERLARIRRDYMDGKLTAGDWQGFRGELEEQLQAASAARERQEVRARELETAADLSDGESDVLRRLAELRAAVVGELRDAATIEALRAALVRLFESFTLTTWADLLGRADEALESATEDRLDAIEAAVFGGGGSAADTEAILATMLGGAAPVGASRGYLLVPHVRRDAFQGFTPDLEPVLRREPLSLSASGQTKQPTACRSFDCLLGPIPLVVEGAT